MCCNIFHKVCNQLGYKFRLFLTVINVAFGTGFLMYSTCVINNVQKFGEDYMNYTFAESHGYFPTDEEVSYLWATVIAAKDVGKILGMFQNFITL